jgi:hypothetical protein
MWVMDKDNDNQDGLFGEGMDNDEIDVPMECLGLDLECTSTVEFGQPVAVIVVAKVVQAGEFGYRMISSPDLQSVEAMGMVRWAQILLDEGILVQAREPEEEYDDADQGEDEEEPEPQ